MGFLKSKFGKIVKAIVEAVLPAVIAILFPEAMINTAAGAVVKHATPIPNNAIPVLNAVASIAVCYVRHGSMTGDWQGAWLPALRDGMILMTASTALHQSIKIPASELIDKKLKNKNESTQFSV